MADALDAAAARKARAKNSLDIPGSLGCMRDPRIPEKYTPEAWLGRLARDFAEDAARDLCELGHVVAQILRLLIGELEIPRAAA